MNYFKPFYYQSLTEIGGAEVETDHLQNLIVEIPQYTSEEIYGFDGMDLIYNPAVMQDIIQWLQSEGDRIIYIYGGNDPLTGAAIELTGQTDALKIIQPGFGNALNIIDLNEVQSVYDALEGWM
jgi:hypothetical protein